MISSVLFVCLGNICRSPSAEAVFRKKAADIGLKIKFDSAGTIGHHTGEKSDSRSIHYAEKRGYLMNHLARKIKPDDFEKFDLILVMDHKNLSDVSSICPQTHRNKVKLIRNFKIESMQEVVPDPYYGSAADFEIVLELIEDSWQGFLKHYFPSEIP